MFELIQLRALLYRRVYKSRFGHNNHALIRMFHNQLKNVFGKERQKRKYQQNKKKVMPPICGLVNEIFIVGTLRFN